jgi:hypothetical protein
MAKCRHDVAQDCPACMQDRIDDLEEALQRILQWSEAYPSDIFHEPSPEECHRAHKLLTANGMTLDAFSASMGRHCLKGIGDIARGVVSTQKDSGNA